MLDQEGITQQLELLAAHRRTLAHLIEQAAQYGGEVFAPPQTANGIATARVEIGRIKEALREGGVQVEDEPNDDGPKQVEPVQSARTGGGQVNAQHSQDFIGQASGAVSQNFGEQTNINTGGGDAAGRDLDKRQGEVFVENSTIIGDLIGGDKVGGDKVMGDQHNINTGGGPFVSGGTVRGDVVGQKTIYQALPNWLRLLSAFAIVVILSVVVLGASGGVAGIRARLDAWGVMPAIRPEQPGETLLVIAPFYYTEGNRNTEAHREIARAIQAQAKEAGLTNLRVELAAAPLRADDRDGAEQIGSRYNASLIVWGDDTGVRVTVNFLNRRGTPAILAQSITISETARTQLANLPAYSRFITDDLPHQLSFLALFAVGQSFAIDQDYDTAIRVIARAIGEFAPGTFAEGLADAYYQLGWLYHNPKHDPVQAGVMYDQAIALDPKFAAAYTNRGLARYEQGDLEGALADFDKAITLDPKNTAAYTNRGVAHYEQGDFKGAIADYDQAITLAPKFAAAYHNRGLARYRQGDLKGAIADYDQTIALEPKIAAAYYSRGIARNSQGDLKGAIADYDQTIALDPKFAVAYYNRGVARKSQGDLKGAIADYDQAIALAPKFAAAYHNRGVARYEQGDLKGALADFDKAIMLEPKIAAAYYGRGLARYEQGDLKGAIADYDQTIAFDPKFTAAYTNRGVARYKQGDFKGAIADYDQAITLDPKNAAVIGSRGFIRYKQGDLKGALADFDKAIALDPKLAGAYYSRGLVYQQQSDRTHAIADFEQVLLLTDDV